VKDYLGNILYRVPLSNGLYNFSASLAHLQPQGLSSIHVSAKLWHRRLGHASFPVINKVISLAPRNKITFICYERQLAKSHAMPFKHVHVHVHVHVSVFKPLQLIYSDVRGPTPILSTTGPCYYISFLDDTTKYLWLFPLKLKSDAHQPFIYFQNVVERQFDTKIKALQSY
jgi:histone deacetylase 1/2